MIATIEGVISARTNDSLIVQVSGLGYQVSVSPAVIQKHETGSMVLLQTKLIVREDNWTLYGFETAVEKDYFDLLLTVSGVGPKSAMAILSVLSVDQIRSAVLSDQPDAFSKVPGVGRKTGQKIILHLQGKLGDLTADLGGVVINALDIDLLEALTGLGYSVAEAQRAIQSIPIDTPNTMEDKLRNALAFFNR